VRVGGGQARRAGDSVRRGLPVENHRHQHRRAERAPDEPFFPGLMRQEMGRQSMHGIFARSLARLAEAGRLAIDDPDEAADHLIALTSNQINARTLFGTVPMSDADLDRLITGGVAAFVRAYRPA
jgi:TetR/AcrR family transcriptional regulator, mexJK operon transcriptional repressor